MTSSSDDPLWIASPYVNWGPSYRVRVQTWIDRTGTPTQLIARGRTVRQQAGPRKFHPYDLRYESCARISREVGDRILIQKEGSRLSHGSLEQSIRKRFNEVIFDIDDAVYLPSSNTVLGSRADRVETILRMADRVIAGNEYLADHCSNFVDDVRIIPTCIEPADYIVKRRTCSAMRLTVGWMGSSSTAHYVDAILPALARVQRDLGIRIVMIGAAGPDVIERDGCVIERLSWSKSTEASMLASLDVGIVPLNDTPWERGKCAYKLLQYGAAGLPAVGSPVGVVGTILDASGAPTPSTSAEWETALRDLVSSEDERRRNGQNLRSHVLSNYTYSSWQTSWIDAIGSNSDPQNER